MALKESEIDSKLKELEGWKRLRKRIMKTYYFKDYKETLDFVNRVGKVAEEMDHHPDMLVSYGKVKIVTFSHDVKGISERDFNLAKRIEEIYKNFK
ncbi:Putative pterin-4-alpha-carbinolamine dehydratase [archaeon HR06]|nr:Putative pterin-4-alpha-carbinolamine dehydratase [archaeon HR06]